MVDCSIKPFQRSGAKHSVRKVIPSYEPGPTGNTLHIGTLYTFVLPTLKDELLSQLVYVELRWNQMEAH